MHALRFGWEFSLAAINYYINAKPPPLILSCVCIIIIIMGSCVVWNARFCFAAFFVLQSKAFPRMLWWPRSQRPRHSSTASSVSSLKLILHLCNFYMKALHNPHNIIIIARSTRVWYAYGDYSETLQHFQMWRLLHFYVCRMYNLEEYHSTSFHGSGMAWCMSGPAV